MRRTSQMGSSNYEFNPEQFDLDVANRSKKYEEQKQEIKKRLTEIIETKLYLLGWI